MPFSTKDLERIAELAVTSTRTVRRLYGGRRTYRTTRTRIERAAASLGLPMPPSANDNARPAMAV